MPKIQFFYDYICPYCKKGYEDLREFLDAHPKIEIEWIPVEAHPRPETYGSHTDLSCQSYYIARELGADMMAFHAAMFQAVAAERRNVEKVDVLVEIVKDLVDAEKFRSILVTYKYRAQVEKNNDLAYEKSGVWFLPAFRAGGKKLDSRGGVGVSREEIREFFN